MVIKPLDFFNQRVRLVGSTEAQPANDCGKDSSNIVKNFNKPRQIDNIESDLTNVEDA